MRQQILLNDWNIQVIAKESFNNLRCQTVSKLNIGLDESGERLRLSSVTEFIDYQTSMITYQDPLQGFCATEI